MFKRYILWQCRVMQKIPGLRAYGRFLERHYTAHFWRTYFAMAAIGWGINYLSYRWLMRWVENNEDFQAPLFDEVPDEELEGDLVG